MKRTVRLVSGTLLLAALAGPPALMAQASAGAGGSGMQKLTLDKYLDWETVSGPQISPDGRQVVYSRGWIDKMNDRRESTLWIANSDGSRKRELVDGASATWSPDGTRIAFVAPGEPEGPQIFVRWMDAEGATTQITRLEQSPGQSPVVSGWNPNCLHNARRG